MSTETNAAHPNLRSTARRQALGRMQAMIAVAMTQSACTTLGTGGSSSEPIKHRVALALGGGAARGFAHVGVIKTLESHGFQPDLIVGTSAGSFVGALYASGLSGFELQRIAFSIDEASLGDWALPTKGLFKGDALAKFVNQSVKGRPIEQLSRPFAAVAANLRTGEPIIFQRGDTGMAVRASSAVPGVFQPVLIGGKEYVDGGVVSPIPVKAARALGATLVIAVDISSNPRSGAPTGPVSTLLHTFTIMGHHLGQAELASADIIIRPDLGATSGTDFQSRHRSMLEGERAAQAIIPELRQRLAGSNKALVVRGG